MRSNLLFASLSVALGAGFFSTGPVFAAETAVASSATHTLVLAPDGTVLAQGRNNHSQSSGASPGQGLDTLTPVQGLPKARAVAVGDPAHSMVLGADGRVYVWGNNSFGFLGGTDRGPKHVREEPTPVERLGQVIGIAACRNAGSALQADGTVWMWGADQQGVMATGKLFPLGDTAKEYYQPRRVDGLQDVVQIACGGMYMLALRNDGTVWAWGRNKDGELGLGDTLSRAVPTQIASLANVTRVVATDAISAARLTDGSWRAWGYVPGTDKPVLTPSVLTPNLQDTIDLGHGIALLRDGTVMTWGSNMFGALGTGKNVDATSKRGVRVKTLSSMTRVWGGGHRALALKSDGTLFLWGPGTDEKVFYVPVVIGKFTLDAAVRPAN